jgi:hypothetical protein
VCAGISVTRPAVPREEPQLFHIKKEEEQIMKIFSEKIRFAMAVLILAPIVCAGCNCSAGECSEAVVEMQCISTDCPVEKTEKHHMKHDGSKKQHIESEVKKVEEEARKIDDSVKTKLDHPAHHMAETMLKAIKHKDYDMLAKGMPEGCTIPVTAEEFQTSSEVLEGQFGELTDYEFITELETPLVCNQLWKAAFRKKDSEGNDVKQELIFRFVTAERDGCNQIIGFGFM